MMNINGKGTNDHSTTQQRLITRKSRTGVLGKRKGCTVGDVRPWEEEHEKSKIQAQGSVRWHSHARSDVYPVLFTSHPEFSHRFLEQGNCSGWAGIKGGGGRGGSRVLFLLKSTETKVTGPRTLRIPLHNPCWCRQVS